MLRRPVIAVGLAASALVVLAASWWVWRQRTPIEVQFASRVVSVPLEVAVSPPVARVQPGELISATYRIRNTSILPVAAFGRVLVEPASAHGQVQVFLTQCGGLNTYQNSGAQDYAVVVRVQAGVFGARHVTIRHEFVAATP